MPSVTESFLTSTTMLQNPGQADAQAAAAAARASAAEARAQAQAAAADARDRAADAREQVQEFKQNLKEQIQAEIDAARAAQGGIPVPPTPPDPPHFPGWTVQDGGPQVIPQQAVEIVSIVGMTLVLCVVGFPIARAIARWMDRRGTPVQSSPEMNTRLHAIEQAVESIAVEVERISEGQRFTTRVLSERTHEPVNDFVAREREAMHVGLPPDSGPGAPVNARRT